MTQWHAHSIATSTVVCHTPGVDSTQNCGARVELAIVNRPGAVRTYTRDESWRAKTSGKESSAQLNRNMQFADFVLRRDRFCSSRYCGQPWAAKRQVWTGAAKAGVGSSRCSWQLAAPELTSAIWDSGRQVECGQVTGDCRARAGRGQQPVSQQHKVMCKNQQRAAAAISVCDPAVARHTMCGAGNLQNRLLPAACARLQDSNAEVDKCKRSGTWSIATSRKERKICELMLAFCMRLREQQAETQQG